MKPEQQLSTPWTIWLSFSSDAKDLTSYQNNLIPYLQLKNWADVAYTWTHSTIKSPNAYFVDANTGQYTKHEINGELKKIQSINIFKKNIQPTWEFGDNSKGGYFRFSLLKQISTEIVENIYSSLVFMALGNSSQICNYLRGVRIVDSSAKKKYRCRFQLWVNYQDDDQNLVMIKRQAEEIKALIEKMGTVINDIQFFNIDSKIKVQQKDGI